MLGRMSAANVVKMTYGYDIESDHDKLTQYAVESSACLSKAGVPCMTFVDFFPVRECRYYFHAFLMSHYVESSPVLPDLVSGRWLHEGYGPCAQGGPPVTHISVRQSQSRKGA